MLKFKKVWEIDMILIHLFDLLFSPASKLFKIMGRKCNKISIFETY